MGPAWVVAEDGDGDEMLPWLPHACGGKLGMPAMWAALCAMSTSAARASEACLFLALSSLYRRLAFSTCQRYRSNAHSAFVIPSGRSFSGLPLFFAGGAAAVTRGAAYFFGGMLARSGLCWGKWREWEARREGRWEVGANFGGNRR